MNSIGVISRFMKHLSKLYFAVAKRVLCHLQRTKKLGILYNRETDNKLVGYTDSDWAGSIEYRKSTYLFIGKECDFMEFKKAKIVAISSAEAEYIATTSPFWIIIENKEFIKY